MRREEEARQPITMRKVTIENISALSPGICAMSDVWVEVGGARVTEVPVGGSFNILCSYIARNNSGGSWRITATVKGDGIQNYQTTGVLNSTEHQETGMKLGRDPYGNNIMPDKDITLVFNLWLNDDYNISPAYPPVSDW